MNDASDLARVAPITKETYIKILFHSRLGLFGASFSV